MRTFTNLFNFLVVLHVERERADVPTTDMRTRKRILY